MGGASGAAQSDRAEPRSARPYSAGSQASAALTPAEQVAASKAYKAGCRDRILTKAAAASLCGCVLAPFARSGFLPLVSLAGGVSAGGAVAFYDTLREAVTSVTLVDSPLTSLFCGGMTGVCRSAHLQGV